MRAVQTEQVNDDPAAETDHSAKKPNPTDMTNIIGQITTKAIHKRSFVAQAFAAQRREQRPTCYGNK
jgi:hypothetical protein